MKQDFDAIVIGAGLGGLSASASLAGKGRSVLLLERHNVPGGYATSFMRGGYEFEIALHALTGVDARRKTGPLYGYLEELGVADRIEFVPLHSFYRSIFPGLDVTLPFDRRGFEDVLCDLFPSDAAGIRRFVRSVIDLHDEVRGLIAKKGGINPLTVPLRFPRVLRHLATTVDNVLCRMVDDPRARAVITQTWQYYGLPSSRLSFLLFALATGSYLTLGGSFPRGLSQGLSGTILQRFIELGGTARLGCAVMEIMISNGAAIGVKTADGSEYRSRAVISNADMLATCRDMIGFDRLPGGFVQSLSRGEPGVGSFGIYLGLNGSPEALGINAHETFFNSSYDQDAQFSAYGRMDRGESPVLLASYNSVYPEIAPEGRSIYSINTSKFIAPWLDLAPKDYQKAKSAMAERLISQVEGRFPGFRESIEVVETATPLTNVRYTGNTGGSFLGFANTAHNHSIFRIGVKGPIKGLYFAGAWTQPGGGMEAVMISGRDAAKAATSDLGD
jgi:prolycopene isomerase